MHLQFLYGFPSSFRFYFLSGGSYLNLYTDFFIFFVEISLYASKYLYFSATSFRKAVANAMFL